MGQHGMSPISHLTQALISYPLPQRLSIALLGTVERVRGGSHQGMSGHCVHSRPAADKQRRIWASTATRAVYAVTEPSSRQQRPRTMMAERPSSMDPHKLCCPRASLHAVH
jgi:hypothetical protein